MVERKWWILAAMSGVLVFVLLVVAWLTIKR